MESTRHIGWIVYLLSQPAMGLMNFMTVGGAIRFSSVIVLTSILYASPSQ